MRFPHLRKRTNDLAFVRTKFYLLIFIIILMCVKRFRWVFICMDGLRSSRKIMRYLHLFANVCYITCFIAYVIRLFHTFLHMSYIVMSYVLTSHFMLCSVYCTCKQIIECKCFSTLFFSFLFLV